MNATWLDRFDETLVERYGKTKAEEMSKTYRQAFPASYRDKYDPDMAMSDLHFITQLSAEKPLLLDITQDDKAPNYLHMRVFQWQTPASLSDILPMLEHFHLRTEREYPHQLRIHKDEVVWVSDFLVKAVGSTPIELNNDAKQRFQAAFSHVYLGNCENDGLNSLVLQAGLTWREVVVLRAYTKYLLQIRSRYHQGAIEKALTNHPDIARHLVALFIGYHAVENRVSESVSVERVNAIMAQFDTINSLEEDYILRRFLNLIQCTVRTNYFQETADNKPKAYLALKFRAHDVTELPLPKPLFEVFVYAADFEGTHLRHDKVSRGGIRWSIRREDFRTEILGLMKAQVVKNAVIVPSGAKGGFVLKKPANPGEITPADVKQAYTLFIKALLDITDNIKNKQVIHPARVVCFDEQDTYLVVAADKGTATFSDLANSISNEYNFWLGDAFASGGSVGYDHKKMGITAAGMWVSIKRHFRDLEIDIDKAVITVVGIGDMSGDVFGNGLLHSDRLKLIAAFDHRDIFIDPSPDPVKSFVERKRLFEKPASSWADYEKSLISKGGGVFSRSLKAITLTPEMKACLSVDADILTPNELIRAALMAPVDVLLNGGVGTYVKASDETSEDVGDRTNDYCRVDGKSLRCKVVGEGGNLGFTQRARIEYALKGGLIYTDFIDNSAGVDCSDHEVNLKILLDAVVREGLLNEPKRQELLKALTDDIATLVLSDNHEQALVMSYSAFSSKRNIGLHSDYIKELESQGLLNRRIEYLPDEKVLAERKTNGLGLTRPELAVLLAYTKIYIKKEILASALPEDPYLQQIIEKAFPASIKTYYGPAMRGHLLKREIIATQLANEIVDQMGITFVYRLQMETGATISAIIRAYAIATQSFNTLAIQRAIESLDFKITVDEQFTMLHNVRKLINLATRWFLHVPYLNDSLQKQIDHYKVGIHAIEDLVPKLMSGVTRDYLETIRKRFSEANLSPEIAERIGTYRAIYTSLNIIDVAMSLGWMDLESDHLKLDIEKTAIVYFSGGEKLHLVWFRDQIANDTRQGHWEALTCLTLRDELDNLQRLLTMTILKEDDGKSDAEALIDKWMADNTVLINRWEKFLAMLHSNVNADVDYTLFFIAIRELNRLLGCRNGIAPLFDLQPPHFPE